MFYQSLITGERPYQAALMDFEREMPPHWHSEIEILYCLSGSYKVRIGNSEYFVPEGDAVFVGSAELHEYYGIAPQTRALLIEIGPMLLKQGFMELAERTFSSPVLRIRGTGSELEGLFKVIAIELEAKTSTEGEWAVRGCLYALAAVMRRSLQKNVRMDARQGRRLKTLLNVYKAINFVHENYSLDIKVEDMARLTGYQVSNFCRHFKWATKLSFHQYLNAHRINVACCLLTEQSEPVSAVAERVGFAEAKTFCRVFKQCVGMTPTQYRQKQGTT